ncbi:MAG: DUF7478 domain-containing protein [Polyangiales bacterium]
MRFFFFALFGSLVLCSCSASDGGGVASDGATSGDTAVTGEDGVASGGDSTSEDDGGAGSDTGTAADTAPAIPFCTMTCASSSDCATASAAFDADNYACESGTCRYVGCLSDSECTSSFASSAYACRKLAGSTISTCVHTCAKAADCATASAAYDADNYSCDSGSCTYLGCKTDDECKSSFASSAYVCRTIEVPKVDPLPTAAKNCVKSCSVAADCATASAAYDADNYACEGGLCHYVGCKSDAECKSSFMKSNYACR